MEASASFMDFCHSFFTFAGHFNPEIFNPKLQSRTFQPHSRFSTMNSSTADFSTMNPRRLKELKNLWLNSSWLKILGMNSSVLKLGVEKSGLKCPATFFTVEWILLHPRFYHFCNFLKLDDILLTLL